MIIELEKADVELIEGLMEYYLNSDKPYEYPLINASIYKLKTKIEIQKGDKDGK